MSSLVGSVVEKDAKRFEALVKVCAEQATGYRDIYGYKTHNPVTKVPTIVEIGTLHGHSTRILAKYGKVHTYDINDYGNKFPENVIVHIVKERVQPENLPMDFDFAYIDGDHSYEGVSHDFEVVKHCGKVIFHDYHSKCLDVVKFVNSLGINVFCDPPFALWWKD